MITQKTVTILAQNHVEEIIKISRYSGPNQKVIQLYDVKKNQIHNVKKKNM
jgi:hypothetical protein